MKINVLKLYTANLSKQIAFYTDTIGLEILEQGPSQVSFRIGCSKLVLEERNASTPYHFAINIPCNQENDALNWLKERVTILKDGTNEIQNFVSWNAKAMYFYDVDKNIVEFIARKTLNNESDQEFSSTSLLEISEIGMPVQDVALAYKSLNKIVEFPIYSGDLDRFCAIGDAKGLFICINKNIKDWFPTNEKAYSSPFKIIFEEKGKSYPLTFENETLRQIIS